MFRYIAVFASLFSLLGCSEAGNVTPPSVDVKSSFSGSQSIEREIFHQASLSIQTPMQAGSVEQYLLLSGEVRHLDTREFDGGQFRLHVGFNAPASTDSSALLLHLVAAPHVSPPGLELLCFAYLTHDTTRHSQTLDCDYFSTVTYFIAASRIGRPTDHPFHDIQVRLPAWRALLANRENELTGLYVSIFTTLQHALLSLSGNLYDGRRLSARPVMETVISRFFDAYQRSGHISAAQLIEIANDVTGGSAPLERILRFQSIFERFAYVADVELTASGGSLTDRGTSIELPTMAQEVSRFFMRGSPLAMSDVRTRLVRRITHEIVGDSVILRWEPIAHMYGYSVYLNGEQVAFTRLPELSLDDPGVAVITVRAVGYGGEFDGVHYDLASHPVDYGAFASAIGDVYD